MADPYFRNENEVVADAAQQVLDEEDERIRAKLRDHCAEDGQRSSAYPAARCECETNGHGHEGHRCPVMLVREDEFGEYMFVKVDPEGPPTVENGRVVCRACLEKEGRWCPPETEEDDG